MKKSNLLLICLHIVRTSSKITKGKQIMYTPRKYDIHDRLESDIVTPFKGRALEEQRLRDALLLSTTPGLKRRLEIQSSIAPLHNNANDIKLYLRDLSSALALQGKNLMNKLGEEETKPLEEERLLLEMSQPDTIIKATPKRQYHMSGEFDDVSDINSLQKPGALHEIEPEEPKTLSQLVFSQLKDVRKSTKIRKLEPINIRDVSSTDRPGFGEDHDQNIVASIIENPFETDGLSPQPNFSNEPSEATQNESIQVGSPIDKYESSPQFTMPIDIEADNIPIQSEHSKSMFSNHRTHEKEKTIPEQNNIPTDKITVETLKILYNNYILQDHPHLKDRLKQELNTVTSRIIEHILQRKKYPDIRSILKFMTQKDLFPKTIDMDKLFEVCCNLLPLEDLTELENEWF